MVTDNFPLPLVGEMVDNGYSLMLTQPFLFVDGDYRVEVPSFFITDFNSTPRIMWAYFPKWEFPDAGVVHDYLYRFNGVSRQRADEVHHRILQLRGMRKAKRNLAYYVLRAFGWAAWNKYRAEEQKEGNV